VDFSIFVVGTDCSISAGLLLGYRKERRDHLPIIATCECTLLSALCSILHGALTCAILYGDDYIQLEP
jgi:hypothetical protein